MKNHEHYMLEALRLAEKGRRTTSPNPMVGACVVRNGRIVGQGYHRRYGGDHAEIEALKKAGSRAKGATLYVTLEPCASWGKTPPCVTAVFQAGIRNVVIGSLDPNPRNHGKGVLALRKEGIRVTSGILAREIRKQNEAFFKYVKSGLPFVILKMAQSLDGKIAASTGSSRWISGEEARKFVHDLRAEQDAILVGKNTLFKDNPRLNPRIKDRPFPNPGKPWRVVLDSELAVSPRARVFEGDQITLIAVSERKMKKFSAPRSSILVPLHEKRGKLDTTQLLKKLGSLGVAKLLVEGGGELAWSLLNAGQVDKGYWIQAPKIIGGRSAKTSVEGEGIRDLDRAIPCRIEEQRKLGEDLLFVVKFGNGEK